MKIYSPLKSILQVLLIFAVFSMPLAAQQHEGAEKWVFPLHLDLR